jgi:ATP/maltotriose-dependent transcriptional regulator MalT
VKLNIVPTWLCNHSARLVAGWPALALGKDSHDRSTVGAVQVAQEAFARHSWHEAYTLLTDACDGLDADELEMLAVAANLIGRDNDSIHAWERAHVDHLRAGRRERAAQSACWAALVLLLRGEMAQAGAWMTRAERIVDELGADAPVAARGMLLIPAALAALTAGDAQTAGELAERIITIAIAVDEPDLLAFGRLAAAQAVLVAGDISRSMRMFDEVMLSVTMGDVSPIPAGIIYCAVVDGCVEACDLRRAAEWTEALRRWCDDQPDLVPYRGQCMVHRSQVLLAQGAWAEAAIEAELACRRLSEPLHPALGLAHYQRGELLRLRGELDPAAEAYREASRCGHDPAPGLALLRLAEGDVDGAARAARRMLGEHGPGPARCGLLVAAVEVRLAAGDTAGAVELADELASLAAAMGNDLPAAYAAYARGTVLLASGDAPSAIATLRAVCREWRDLHMPYEVARTRYQLGLAYRAVADDDAAALELDAARATFESLGASADLARIDAVAAAAPGVLTARECQVLRLVAAGMTNRGIATELVISEHTVSRHLQNMFMKLGVTTRTAATAYAYQHHLV